MPRPTNGQVLLQLLQAEPWGRELLALADTSPVKTTTATLTLIEVEETVAASVTSLFDAGWIVGISVFVGPSFDAELTNTITFGYFTDLEAVDPTTIPFAVVNDASIVDLPNPAGLGVQVNGVPSSGSDVSFVPLYVTSRFAVIAEFASTGADATQGDALIVYQHVPA